MIQVGVGAWGASWASEVTSSAHWELVALVDPDRDQLDRVADKVELDDRGRFESLAAACDSVEADAVIVVAPPPLHGPLTLEAVTAGLHCLVEKPLSPSIGEARELVKRAEEAG